MRISKSSRGFTLIEIMAAMIIFTIAMAVVVPTFLANQTSAKRRDAVNRGLILDAAKTRYKEDKGVTAAFDEWQAATNDNLKYQLLFPYLAKPPPDLAAYTPLGYSYTLNGLADPTTVTQLSNGKVLSGALTPTLFERFGQPTNNATNGGP